MSKAKRNKEQEAQIKQDLRNIVNEAFKEKNAPDLTKKFNIKRFISGLLENSKTPKLTSFLNRYNKYIQDGMPEYLLYESFADGLKNFETGNKQVAAAMQTINENLRENSNLLQMFKLASEVTDEIVYADLFESINLFYSDKNDMSRDILLESIDNLNNIGEYQRAGVMRSMVNECLEAEPIQYHSNSVNESRAFVREQAAKNDARMEDVIMKRVEKYLNERFDEDEARANKIASAYTLDKVSNKLGLNEKVVSLLSDGDVAKNFKLRDVLDRYENAMINGCYQERIYESLIRDLTPFNYILKVNETIKDIKEKTDKNYQSVLLTRILQEMSESPDSYIYTELVEEDVTRFILAPTNESLIQAINALMPYAANPYVDKMLQVIRDTADSKQMSLSEQAVSITDQIRMIRENVSVESLYSPVLFIRENQSVFSIPNQGYYLKNGNTVCPLDKKNVSQLDESFVQLSRLIAQPNVKIDEDKIYLNGEDMWATIYEDRVVLADGNNEYIEDAESIRNLNELCMRYQSYDTNFFISAAILNENFNNIANLHFAKKITLNSNPNISATLYRLDENIFLSLENMDINSKTFYRNVNPIFCKNAINEHFQINVSSLFEDLLPAQDKIILQLNETKNEYEKSIEQYEDALEDLKAAKEEATTVDIEQQLDDAIADAEKKLQDVKDEYLQWQKETAEVTDAKADDEDDDEAEDAEGDVTKEVSNEPLDADEVEDYKDELSTPLTTNANAETAAPAEEAGSEAAVTDDEFSEYLAQEVSDEEAADIEADVDDAVADEVEAEIAPEEEAELETEPEEEDTVNMVDFGDGENETEYTDDNFFDDETVDQPAEEEIPSDEDILIPSEEEEDIYTDEIEPDEDEYTVVDAETGEADAAQATDLFGGNVESPIEDKSQPNTDLYNPHVETSEFNIVNVMFDENVKTNEIKKSGEVMLVRPMISPDGQKYTEPIKLRFYLNSDNEPVLETTEAITTTMYNAIMDAIRENPRYNEVLDKGIAVDNTAANPIELDNLHTAPEEEVDVVAEEPEEEIVVANEPEEEIVVADEPAAVEPDIEDITEPEEVEVEVTDDEPVIADTEDLFTDFDLDDEESDTEVPAEILAPEVPETDPVDTYTDVDGTEIEVPAPEADAEETETPEEDEDESIIPESKKAPKANAVNENRKAILNIKKTGKRPF